MATLPAGSVDAIITDPPYETTDCAWDKRIDEGDFFRLALKSRAVGFLNAKKMPLRKHENILVFSRNKPTYNPQFTQGKPYIRQMRVKHGEVYGVNNSCSTENSGYRYPVSVLNVKQPTNCSVKHPTNKPVDLLEWLIKTYTNTGETVLDPFMGCGPCGVAAVRNGRRFIGCETNKGYFDGAKVRICQEIE